VKRNASRALGLVAVLILGGCVGLWLSPPGQLILYGIQCGRQDAASGVDFGADMSMDLPSALMYLEMRSVFVHNRLPAPNTPAQRQARDQEERHASQIASLVTDSGPAWQNWLLKLFAVGYRCGHG
jgi:hypothetical protein